MATNPLVLPPLGSAPLVEAGSGVLSRFGLSTLQGIVNALGTSLSTANTAASTATALAATVAAIPAFPTPASPSYGSDAAAESGGVAVGSYYRNGSVIQMRVS